MVILTFVFHFMILYIFDLLIVNNQVHVYRTQDTSCNQQCVKIIRREIVCFYKQLHWFCEACNKAAIDAILKPTSISKHKDLVIDIVTQIGEVSKEVNESIIIYSLRNASGIWFG